MICRQQCWSFCAFVSRVGKVVMKAILKGFEIVIVLDEYYYCSCKRAHFKRWSISSGVYHCKNFVIYLWTCCCKRFDKDAAAFRLASFLCSTALFALVLCNNSVVVNACTVLFYFCSKLADIAQRIIYAVLLIHYQKILWTASNQKLTWRHRHSHSGVTNLAQHYSLHELTALCSPLTAQEFRCWLGIASCDRVKKYS